MLTISSILLNLTNKKSMSGIFFFEFRRLGSFTADTILTVALIARCIRERRLAGSDPKGSIVSGLIVLEPPVLYNESRYAVLPCI